MVKAVIFDFDGVIINSSEVQKHALLESFKLVVGKGEPSISDFFSHSGDSLQNILTKMNLPIEMIEPYKMFSRERIKDIKVHTGMKDFLEYLISRDVKCALCTGKDRERTIEILDLIGLRNYFDVIICSDDVSAPKPNPESLQYAINCLGGNINHSVMVGDAKNDILCAKAANVPCIAVTWGDTETHILEKESPDYIVSDIKELSGCIDRVLKLNSRKKLLINDFVVAEDICNMNCKYCLTDISEFKEKHKANKKKPIKNYAYEQNEKLKDNIDSISKHIHNNFDTAILKISGGELLLVKGIEKYISEQSKKYKVVQILTNGVLLNDKLLNEFKKLGNICMQISIDHHTLEGNSYRTENTNVLNRILDNIDKTVKANIPLEINCVLTDRNTEKINEFADYLVQYDGGVMMFPFPIRGPLRDDFYPKTEQLDGVKKLIDNYSKYKKIIAPKLYLEYLYKFLISGTRETCCSLPFHAIGTFDDGTVTPCPNYWFNDFGSLLKDDIGRVVSKVGSDKIYKLLSENRLPECKKCFTPWDILNLYIEGIISLDELCKSPLYSFPDIREYLVSLKKSYMKNLLRKKTIGKHI